LYKEESNTPPTGSGLDFKGEIEFSSKSKQTSS